MKKVEKTGILKQAPNLAWFKKTVESDVRIVNLNYGKGVFHEYFFNDEGNVFDFIAEELWLYFI